MYNIYYVGILDAHARVVLARSIHRETRFPPYTALARSINNSEIACDLIIMYIYREYYLPLVAAVLLDTIKSRGFNDFELGAGTTECVLVGGVCDEGFSSLDPNDFLTTTPTITTDSFCRREHHL